MDTTGKILAVLGLVCIIVAFVFAYKSPDIDFEYDSLNSRGITALVLGVGGFCLILVAALAIPFSSII